MYERTARGMRKLGIAVGVLAALLGVMVARAEDRTAEWNALVDEFLEKVYFPQNPSAATLDGLHQYDAEMEEYSKAGAESQMRVLREYEAKVEHFSAAGLRPVDAADREILLGQIRSELLSKGTLRPLEENPDVYSGGATNSVYLLMIRKFAPVDERLRNVVAREGRFPAFCDRPRESEESPRVSTEIAIEQLPGIIGFFEKDVPAAFADAQDQDLRAAFARSNAEAIAALKAYLDWLKSDCWRGPSGISASAARISRRSCITRRWWIRRWTV